MEAVQQFCADLPWETVQRRADNSKAGRSYIHPEATMQAVPELDALHHWMETCLNEVRASVGWREETVRDLAIS